MTKFVIALICLVFGSYANAADVPVASYAMLPAVESPILSPDGQYLAAIVNTGATPVVAVSRFGSRDLTTILKLESAQDRIEWIRWANDERLLVSASYPVYFSYERIRVRRLHAVNRDGSGLLELRQKKTDSFNHKGVSAVGDGVLNWNSWRMTAATDGLASILPDDPNQVLVQIYDERDTEYTIYKVDIYTNAFTKQVINDLEMGAWIADGNGDVRLGIKWDREGWRRHVMANWTLWFRKRDTDPWQELPKQTYVVGETFEPVMLDEDGSLIVLSNHEIERDALWRYDLDKNQFQELLFAADGYDVDGVLWDTEHRRIVGASYFDHYERHVYFDPEYRAQQASVQGAFPDYHALIASRSRDNSRLLVAVMRDDSPVRYFWLDSKSRKAGAWFSEYPALEDTSHARVQPFEFEARDGMPLTGYLTLPAGAKSAPPLVLLPHPGLWAHPTRIGGERLPDELDFTYHAGYYWTRDTQAFDPLVQFLARQGYAVLQVNYRGSGGFGTKYSLAGHGQWADGMQGDLYDAVVWLTKRGDVDTSRVCMVGAGYGGFAALAAAYQVPAGIRCAIAMGAITDIARFVDGYTGYLSPRYWIWKSLVGDPEDAAERDLMKQLSPIRNLHRDSIPILLLHGEYDSIVPDSQTERYYIKGKSIGMDLTYVELQAGTHFLDDSKNRLTAYQAIEEFLAEHLRKR